MMLTVDYDAVVDVEDDGWMIDVDVDVNINVNVDFNVEVDICVLY